MRFLIIRKGDENRPYEALDDVELKTTDEMCLLVKGMGGKEIYEGDIIASSYFGKDRKLKVVFFEGCFCLCELYAEPTGCEYISYFRQGSRFRPQDDYEVIGNIHESADLLKEEE